MQVVLSSDPFNYNTRSCGTHDFALIQLTADLLSWADEIVCADTEHFNRVHYFHDRLAYLKDTQLLTFVFLISMSIVIHNLCNSLGGAISRMVR